MQPALRWTLRLLLSLCLCALRIPLHAQTSRGTVTGVVTDASKAAVPNAEVEMVSRRTGVPRKTKTNEAGIYRFDAVDLGDYDIAIKAVGFNTYSSRNVPVRAAQVSTVDAALDVGEATTSIEVNSDSVQLQMESPVRGGNISTAQITDLPVASRNPAMLAVTLPGVTENRANLPGVATFSVNGSRGRSNNFLLDGTENNDISVGGQAFQVKIPEAVEEVSVQTANYDAEFGRAGGAVVNVITKAGTNTFHGSLGWQADFSNDDAITNTLSLSPAIRQRGKLLPGYDQYYSGTLGGPIVRDRAFFFTSWQEQRQRATNTTIFTGLSALGRQQLRSAFSPGVNPRADLYLDVTSGAEATGNFSTIDLGSGRGTVQAGTGVLPYPLRLDGRQTLNKADHRFSDSDLLSVRYGFDRSISPGSMANFPGFFTSTGTRYHNAVLTETHIFSPALTNELRSSYNRIIVETPLDAIDPRAATLPRFNFTGLTGIGVDSRFPQGRVANNFILQDTINWVRSAHSLRFGFDLLQQRARQSAPISLRGNYFYGPSNIAGQPSYSAFANFVDDFGGGGGGSSRDFGTPVYYPELFRQAYFFQDRWQVRRNFTLTLGLRWEDHGTPVNSLRTPAYAGIFNVKFDPANKTFSAPFTEPNQTNRDLNNFAPTVGLTFSPIFRSGLGGWLWGDRKSVIRTGYNIGYDTFFNNIASNVGVSSPNLVATTARSTVNAANPRGLANVSSSLPVTPRTVLPTDPSNLVVKDLRNPYYQKWSFGIQRELPWGLVIDSSYVGTSGTRLYIQEDLNPLVSEPARRILPPGYSSVDQLEAAAPYALSTRLDPLQGDRNTRTNGGHSSYHAAQFELRKRFTRDLGFTLAYTWSKLLDNGSEIFLFNNSSPNAAIPSPFGGGYLEKAVSLYDRPYRFVITYNYLFPIFRAQRGFLGRVLGGWQLAGITTLESGVPLNVTNGADADGIGGQGDRPDLNPAGKAGVRARPDATSPTGYVNPDVLGSNGLPVPIDPSQARYIGLPTEIGRTGNAGRNLERTPGIRSIDLNAIKQFRIREQIHLELRTEFYNLLNHPQYGVAGISPFASIVNTPASIVSGSLAGRFLNYSVMDGGGRAIRYRLTLRF